MTGFPYVTAQNHETYLRQTVNHAPIIDGGINRALAFRTNQLGFVRLAIIAATAVAVASTVTSGIAIAVFLSLQISQPGMLSSCPGVATVSTMLPIGNR
jgi:hypothetical protein